MLLVGSHMLLVGSLMLLVGSLMLRVDSLMLLSKGRNFEKPPGGFARESQNVF
jgi:hypothetical protein